MALCLVLTMLTGTVPAGNYYQVRPMARTSNDGGEN